MGICLDTEQNNGPQEFGEEGDEAWHKAEHRGLGVPPDTPPNGSFPMQNGGHVKFEPPKVPVIFVLGGPGSGKVTHCDNLMQEKRGVTHINMTDLLQQYAIGNDMQDFGQLSSKTVTEVLMLEMKMSPAAKTYLVSGYPRSMRDVVEYSDKIQVVNGVILISWRQKVLEKQIDYGAKLGHVVLSLAKMELNNFFRNVMPVAEYFDQSDMLMTVNGERSPGEVYKDFRAAVLKILGAHENPSAAANGIVGVGADGIPGEIVGVEPAPKRPAPAAAVASAVESGSATAETAVAGAPPRKTQVANAAFKRAVERIRSRPDDIENVEMPLANPVKNGALKTDDVPPVLWIIGGPGSNKAALSQSVLQQLPGWLHISVGTLLRAMAASEPRPLTEAYRVKGALAAGELAATESVMTLLKRHLQAAKGATGALIDGFPRDLQQAKQYEETFKQRPHMVLLDCSKLQLGRGRPDDTVSAFRRRLETFRERSLPMLKALDTEGRLTIVDGDTDTRPVREEFARAVIKSAKSLVPDVTVPSAIPSEGPIGVRQALSKNDAVLHDLEEATSAVPSALPTVSEMISRNQQQPNLVNGGIANGHVLTGKQNVVTKTNLIKRDPVRGMFSDVDSYQLDTHI